VGERAVEALLVARKAVGGRFTHLVEVTENVDLTLLNRAALEALIKCGAFDSLGFARSRLHAALDDCIKMGQSTAADRKRGQADLFGTSAAPPPPTLPDVPEWPEPRRLADEKELTGLYHSSHPLARHERTIKQFGTADSQHLRDRPPKQEVVLGGMIRAFRPTVTKTGRSPGSRMALFELEDFVGSVKCVIFPRDYERAQEWIADDRVVFVRATIDTSREEPGLKVSDVYPAERGREILCKRVVLNLKADQCDPTTLQQLAEAVRNNIGNVQVFLSVADADGATTLVKAGYAYGVSPGEAFDRKVAALIGADAVQYA